MRSDDALLLDMLIAARKIRQFTSGMTQEAFAGNEMAQSAVIREFQVIGEAARMVSHETKTQQDIIAWQVIAGLRNRLVHEYFNIELKIVWDTIRDDVPALIAQLEAATPQDKPNEARDS